ncbi:MAG: alanyl-tRNA editing protein [Alphaproteobacteria bacterium]|nr:alanyl-tRNA editing protein [Alphaproteobacteria bacterium]
MTDELFRTDSYLRTCTARVVAATGAGVVLDRTVFYPTGGGQPGDTGILTTKDGKRLQVSDTRKGPDGILHVVEDITGLPAAGEEITAEIDWDRRHVHMRVHTAMHVLCSLVDGAVTGGSIGAGRGRIDFDIPGERPDKQQLTDRMMQVIEANEQVGISWITDADLAANPDLVRTMSVKPPSGSGRVRMIRIGAGVDFQPCGGTHVAATGEIGPVSVAKIENKGRRNRRISFVLG